MECANAGLRSMLQLPSQSVVCIFILKLPIYFVLVYEFHVERFAYLNI